MTNDDTPIAVLIISRQLSQAYTTGEDFGDLLTMRMLKDAAFEKDDQWYAAIEQAIRVGMGMVK